MHACMHLKCCDLQDTTALPHLTSLACIDMYTPKTSKISINRTVNSGPNGVLIIEVRLQMLYMMCVHINVSTCVSIYPSTHCQSHLQQCMYRLQA